MVKYIHQIWTLSRYIIFIHEICEISRSEDNDVLASFSIKYNKMALHTYCAAKVWSFFKQSKF